MDWLGFADERAWENTPIPISTHKNTKSKSKEQKQPVSDPYRVLADIIIQKNEQDVEILDTVEDKNMKSWIADADHMRNLYLWEKQADEANAGIMAANSIGNFAVYADERFMQEFISVMNQSVEYLKKLIQERRMIIGAVEEAVQKRKHAQNLRLELEHQRYKFMKRLIS